MIVHAYYEEDPRVRREAESLVAAGRPVQVLGLRQAGRAGDLGGGRRSGPSPRRAATPGRRARRVPARVPVVPGSGDGRRGPAAPPRAVRPGPGPLAARLPGVRGPAAASRRRPGRCSTCTRRCPSSSAAVSRAPRTRSCIGCCCSRSDCRSRSRPRRSRSTRRCATGSSGWACRRPRSASSSTARRSAGSTPRRTRTRAFREDGRLRLVYTGALTPTYELDVAIAAVARIAAARPDLDVAFEVYGRGDSGPALAAQAAELGIADRVTFHGRIPIEDVPAAVAARRHRPRPDPPRPVHRHEPLDQGVRVRRDGQARRRVAPADGRAHVPARHRRDLPAGRRGRRWPTRSLASRTTLPQEKQP